MRGGDADPDVTSLGDSDRTILTGGLHYFDPGPVTSPSITSGTGGTSPTMMPWKLEALPELEAILVRQIGPMGRILLKKIAGRAEGVDELCRLLLPHIPSDVGRVQFQQAVETLKRKLTASGTGSGIHSLHGATSIGGAGASGIGTIDASGTGAGRSAIRPPTVFDDAWADAMTQRLTQRIGPIARVVAKRAAAQTRDKTEFLLLLAQHIESAPERARFLADTGMS